MRIHRKVLPKESRGVYSKLRIQGCHIQHKIKMTELRTKEDRNFNRGQATEVKQIQKIQAIMSRDSAVHSGELPSMPKRHQAPACLNSNKCSRQKYTLHKMRSVSAWKCWLNIFKDMSCSQSIAGFVVNWS